MKNASAVKANVAVQKEHVEINANVPQIAVQRKIVDVVKNVVELINVNALLIVVDALPRRKELAIAAQELSKKELLIAALEPLNAHVLQKDANAKKR